MLWRYSWLCISAVLSITKCQNGFKVLQFKISRFENNKMYVSIDLGNNATCKDDAMVIETVTIGKTKNNDEMCIKDLRNGTNDDLQMLSRVAYVCSGKHQCRPKYFAIQTKPSVACDSKETEPDFIHIHYTCKPINDTNTDVWNISSMSTHKQLTEYFYMVLKTVKSEHHMCSLLSNSKPLRMKILHLNFNQGDENLKLTKKDDVNLNNGIMDIRRTSFSEFISNNVTSVAGGNITMEIQFKFGGVVWIEVQASCGANMTCYTFQGQQPKLSAHLNRSCENIKATTIVTSVSSSATTIVTSLNSATTIVTSPLTEASTSVTSSKSKATTIVINPFKQASTIATTFETIATTSATSPLKEDELSTLKYIAICVGVVAIVFLVLFIIFCAKFYRRKKKKTELNIYDIPEIHKEDQSPYDNGERTIYLTFLLS